MANDRTNTSAASGPIVARRYSPYVVIEIGSSAARILVVQPNPNGTWKQLGLARMRTNLTKGGYIDERLFGEMVEWLKATTQRAHTIFNSHDVDVEAFATAAFREPANAAEYKEKLLELTGYQLQIIDGESEAMYAWSGACSEAPTSAYSNRKQVVIDIGGRSSEIAIGLTDGQLFEHESFNTGHFDNGANAKARSDFETFAAQHSDAARLLLTAGTAKLPVLASAVLEGKAEVTYGRLTHQQIIDLKSSISLMTSEQVDGLISSGLAGSTRGGDLITAIDSLEKLTLIFQKSEIVVVPGGVRTGYVNHSVEKMIDEYRFGFPQTNQRYVEPTHEPSRHRRL